MEFWHAVLFGPKPRWEALELTLVDNIWECHAQRKAVTRGTVVHKELEFEPNFLGVVVLSYFQRTLLEKDEDPAAPATESAAAALMEEEQADAEP